MLAIEIARWLRVGVSTVYQWAAEDKIPSLNLNGSIRFIRSDIERWMRNPTDTPAPSLSAREMIATSRPLSQSAFRQSGLRVIQRFRRQHLVPRTPPDLPIKRCRDDRDERAT